MNPIKPAYLLAWATVIFFAIAVLLAAIPAVFWGVIELCRCLGGRL